MIAALKIDRIETWSCTVPLDQPIDFGQFTITERKHCLLRMSTSDGLTTDVVGQSRGAPIDIAIQDLFAPLLIGRSATNHLEIRRAAAAAMTPLDREGTLNRAWSLIEIGLQDLRAQAVGLPLWQMLGGDPKPLAVQLIEGYALQEESAESFVDRLVARVDEGYRLIKVEAAHYETAESLLGRLELFYRLAGNRARLVLDFAWSWQRPGDHARLLDGLREFDIAWIEDCFPRTQVNHYRELRRATPLPIGCGDEASRIEDLLALVDANVVDVIRADATTLGGISAVQELSLVAHRAGIAMSCHEHPEIHEHLAFGLGCSDHVEMFPSDRPFDCVHKLVETVPECRVSNGLLIPPDTPGTGVKFVNARVAHYASRSNITKSS